MPADEALAYLVFAQQERPVLDEAALAAQARRFFEAEAAFVAEGAPEPEPPYEAAARVSVRPDQGGGGARACFGRRADSADWAAAEQAEARVAHTGLSLLARRCTSLWVVESEGEGDTVALRIATILASLVLGPILLPGGSELCGVRTARAKLGSAGAPYR